MSGGDSWRDRAGRFSPFKAVVLAFILLPGLFLALRWGLRDLGPRPYDVAIHELGSWALRLLVATLAVTPLRRLLRWPRLIAVRRMLGVASACYATLHLALFAVDLKLDLAVILAEMVKRIYLVVGSAALLGLLALAATSTDGMVRRLGGKAWQRLHRLVYPLAALGLLHFAMQSKIDVTQPILLAGMLCLALACRLVPADPGRSGSVRVAALAVACAVAMAGCEALWHAAATGVEAGLVLSANLRPDAGLRPAWSVLATGLAVAAAVAWRARVATAPASAAAPSRA